MVQLGTLYGGCDDIRVKADHVYIGVLENVSQPGPLMRKAAAHSHRQAG